MELKRATSQSGKTLRIVNDGNPILGINIYSIEHRLDRYFKDDFTEIWDIEPSSPITTNKKAIEAYFTSLINI